MTFLLWIILSVGCGKKDQNLDPRYLNAEYKRLSQEMERHASRQRWDKAAKVFEEIQVLNVDISYEDWILAAEVSQELGIIAQSREYLKQAYEIRATSKVLDWRKSIDDQFGDVVLEVKSNESFSFEAKFQISDELKLNVIDYATKELHTNRNFSGLLPVGTYYFVDQNFTVEPGLEIVLSLDPKQRKKGIKEGVIKDLDITKE